MSNAQVGNVYQQIIADVVESSRVDFEEGGVDEHVLEELRMGWQQKLSQLNVATFPWDPKPEPLPISQPPTLPSNVSSGVGPSQPYHPEQLQPASSLGINLGSNGNGPRIKPEPGLDGHQYQAPPVLGQQATTAQQRAAQHLHQNYGPRAAASINAIQAGVPSAGMPGQAPQQALTMQQMQQFQMMRMQAAQTSSQPQGQGGQGRGAPPTMTQEQFNYRQQMHQQAQLQQQRLQNQNGGLGGAQMDGGGDSDVVVMQDGRPMGRVEIDGLLRDRILARGSAMEGGGLMLPLAQASTSSSRKQKVPRKSKHAPGQLDGDDDDDDVKDEDEDAINSDLDDPDDGLGEEDDDEEGELGQIMLCMYDKVQRVKNKWKCVMKDGVLTVNGKEYVFHKASGEYEW